MSPSPRTDWHLANLTLDSRLGEGTQPQRPLGTHFQKQDLGKEKLGRNRVKKGVWQPPACPSLSRKQFCNPDPPLPHPHPHPPPAGLRSAPIRNRMGGDFPTVVAPSLGWYKATLLECGKLTEKREATMSSRTQSENRGRSLPESVLGRTDMNTAEIYGQSV